MLHILLAEDNRGDILLVREALKEHRIEHTLHVVEDGEQALCFVANMGRPGETPCPDLVLLDLNLPKADGQQVLSEFRQHPDCAKRPVIVVTSSNSQRDRARVAALGISHYFCKPSDFDDYMRLGAVVRKVVEGSAA